MSAYTGDETISDRMRRMLEERQGWPYRRPHATNAAPFPDLPVDKQQQINTNRARDLEQYPGSY